MKQYSMQDIHEMFMLFDFDLNIFMMSNPVNSYEQAAEATEKMRNEIKIRFRKLAISVHPDKGGDAEKFKILNQAYNFIQKEVHIEHRPPMPVQQIIFQFYNTYTGTTANTGWTNAAY